MTATVSNFEGGVGLTRKPVLHVFRIVANE